MPAVEFRQVTPIWYTRFRTRPYAAVAGLVPWFGECVRATLGVEAASAHATLLVRAFFAWIGAGPKWAAKTVSNLTVLGERCERVSAAVIVNRARSDAAKESAFASARTALRDTLSPLRFNLSSKPDLAPLIHSIRDLHPTHSISEGAAYRRLQTLKLCTSHPELEAQLRSGELTLTTAAQLRTALDREEKEQRGARRRPTAAPPVGREPRAVSLPRVAPAPEDPSPASEAHVPGAAPPPRPVSRTQGSCQATAAATHAAQRQPASRSQVASDLIEQAAGRSSREVARLIADRNPQASLPRERLRSLGGGRWELRAVIDDSCHAGLEQLRALLTHVDPALSYGELLARLVADGLGKYDPRRQKGRAAAAAPAPERQVTSAPKCAAADANQARAVVAAPAATAAAAGDLAAAAESGSAPTREPRACRAGSGGATGPPLPRSVPRYTGASAAAATPSQPPGGAVLVAGRFPRRPDVACGGAMPAPAGSSTRRPGSAAAPAICSRSTTSNRSPWAAPTRRKTSGCSALRITGAAPARPLARGGPGTGQAVPDAGGGWARGAAPAVRSGAGRLVNPAGRAARCGRRAGGGTARARAVLPSQS